MSEKMKKFLTLIIYLCDALIGMLIVMKTEVGVIQ